MAGNIEYAIENENLEGLAVNELQDNFFDAPAPESDVESDEKRNIIMFMNSAALSQQILFMLT